MGWRESEGRIALGIDVHVELHGHEKEDDLSDKTFESALLGKVVKAGAELVEVGVKDAFEGLAFSSPAVGLVLGAGLLSGEEVFLVLFGLRTSRL